MPSLKLDPSQKSQVARFVGTLHVHTPDAEVTEEVIFRFRKALDPNPPLRRAVVAHALKVHHANLDLFNRYRF